MQTLWTHYYDGRRYVLSYGEWILANLQDMWLPISGSERGTDRGQYMKKELINKERIEELGIGILFIGIGILLAILMIAWLIYNIFISSKG